MTKEELAEIITGRDRREELAFFYKELVKKSGLVIIYGASDDIIEFDGFIRDEIGAYEGTDFIIAMPGDEIPVDEEEETYRKVKVLTPVALNRKQVNEKNFFQALWSPEELDCSWLITTTLPHAPFDIMEDGELFCRGMVIDIKDLQAK